MAQETVIAFDVDGTLIDNDDRPRKQVINALTFLHGLPNVKIVVWSGGGKDYAAMWCRRLAIEDYVDEVAGKDPQRVVDIAFDDMPEVKLGKVQVIV